MVSMVSTFASSWALVAVAALTAVVRAAMFAIMALNMSSVLSGAVAAGAEPGAAGAEPETTTLGDGIVGGLRGIVGVDLHVGVDRGLLGNLAGRAHEEAVGRCLLILLHVQLLRGSLAHRWGRVAGGPD